ncbi:MAG: carboxymuconolactone decarboxylase family protein [Phycisphaerales bacterium]|nr:carboxymuconolactone decarboxylase family protein [Phycisphaerales bacterium]
MSERYDRGLAILREHFGDRADALIENVGAVSPDFARINVEFPFGELYAREGLDQTQRELCALAGLTCLGHALPQLKLHVIGALQCGATEAQVLEVIIQMIAYAGFPAATNALLAAGEAINTWRAERSAEA